MITHVIFRLNRTARASAGLRECAKAVQEGKGKVPAMDLRNVIIDIRNSKLPDPSQYGNAGSFFKNPMVDRTIYNCIRVEYPEVPFFPDEENQMKIPAAWLIEKAGWKGKRIGNVGTWPSHALVIVNYGGATDRKSMTSPRRFIEDVDRQFGISLEREVRVI